MERSPSDGLDNQIDAMLSSDIATRIARAKAYLELQMTEMGLRPSDGWKIQEELRDTDTGTRWVFRPVHLRRDAPDLQTSVILDHDGRAK
jgi:hypothetical protein